MKKLVLLAAVVLGVSTMNAQKNSILLGGNAEYSHDEFKSGGNKIKTDNYTWSPVVGYQFSDHMTVGAKASFGKEDLDALGSNKTTKLGGFLRYAQPFNETFSIYGDLGAGWQKGTEKRHTVDALGNPVDVNSNAEGFYIGFTPALFINFKNNFGLNFSIGGIEYNQMKANGTDSKKDGLDVTLGKAFNIGISKNFAL